MNAIVYPKLREPVKGQKLDAEWGREVVQAIKSITPISGKNIEIHRTQSGSIIRASGEGRRGKATSHESIWVCLITGGDPLTGYSALAYTSMTNLRKDDGTIGVPTTIFPCEIGLDAYMPSGTIVLCHETYVTTAEAMEYLAPYLKSQGWQIVTISEMFAVNGKELKGGTVYTSCN